MYSARQLNILRYLLVQDGYTNYADLSSRLSISSRTLMREMDAIKPTLKKAHLGIQTKKGAGFMITGSREDKEAFLASIKGDTAATQNKSERRMLLGVDLLNAKQPEKLIYYASRYEVSEATISHDLDELEHLLEPFDITLVRKPGFGIRVEAEENKRRQALSWLSQNAMSMAAKSEGFDRYNVQDVIAAMTNNSASTLKQVLNIDILEGILEVFEDHDEELDLGGMAYSSYTGLLIHLMIAVDRLQKNLGLKDNPEIRNLVSDKAAEEKASRIAGLLSEKFAVSFTPAEEDFIAIHLQTAKPAVAVSEAFDENMDLIYRMLLEFKKAGYNLFSDKELYASLSSHLTPVLARLRCNLPIANPLLLQIQQQFPEVYGLSALAADALEKETGLKMNADEIGYLALHFAAALERSKTKAFGKVKVGVVCASGIGLSALLCARLRQIADSEVEIEPLAMDQADKQNIDLIVSSFHLPGALQVSPILEKKDEEAFLAEINRIRTAGRNNARPRQSSVDIGELVTGLQDFIHSIEIADLDRLMTKEQIIETLVGNLEYADAAKQAVLHREAMASNIYSDLHLALFHAAIPEAGKPVLKLARFIRPECKNEEFASIDLVVLMIVKKPEKPWIQDMLSTFSAKLIEEPDFFQILITAQPADIYKEVENQYQSWLISRLKKVDM